MRWEACGWKYYQASSNSFPSVTAPLSGTCGACPVKSRDELSGKVAIIVVEENVWCDTPQEWRYPVSCSFFCNQDDSLPQPEGIADFHANPDAVFTDVGNENIAGLDSLEGNFGDDLWKKLTVRLNASCFGRCGPDGRSQAFVARDRIGDRMCEVDAEQG